ncbi:hypothetical protein [Sulfitobacter sp. R18_1]|uniref:hypothetical protein n=1 Tax=Sulfitobacter sp. R18_1 TaxID=2821104 RepID=UPI001AD95B02|nr:hypothetical protein [Sulfitobacter sp. R18_1]MBO9428303.1 hypothetical protein [Sulfitobacter sp. R18_1]
MSSTDMHQVALKDYVTIIFLGFWWAGAASQAGDFVSAVLFTAAAFLFNGVERRGVSLEDEARSNPIHYLRSLPSAVVDAVAVSFAGSLTVSLLSGGVTTQQQFAASGALLLAGFFSSLGLVFMLGRFARKSVF